MAGVTTYSEAIADAICERIADGESLRDICQSDDMPARSTVFKWLSEQPSFSDRYTRAREEQADAIFDEALSIADDARNDWMERHNQDGESVGWQLNGEHVQRSRLRIETRKWVAGKLRPKVYGDKVSLAGDPENPITVDVRGDVERFTSAIAGLVARSGKSETPGDAG